MKRKLISAVLVLLMVMVLIPWSAMAASSGSCGSGVKWTLDSAGTLTISGTGKMKDYNTEWPPWDLEKVKKVVIKSGVTSIGSYSFCECQNLVSATLPSTITSIGKYAFAACSALKMITIPDSVTKMGDMAFIGCDSLTSAKLSKNLTLIGERSFAGCDKLTSIAIPDKVTEIVEQAFEDCSSLKTVKLSKNLKILGGYVFRGCKALKSITIPSGVTVIEGGNFMECESLSSVTLHNKITEIRESAFSGCKSLTSITLPTKLTKIERNAFQSCGLTSIKIPSTVTSIGEYAFDCCHDLASINIPEGITKLEPWTFLGCSSLKSLKLPQSLKTIGEGCFNEGGWPDLLTSGLTSLTIPANVNTIEPNAFGHMYNLEKLYFEGDAPVFAADTFDCNTMTVYYPAGNKTWTSAKRKNYGGEVTWEAYLPTPTVKAESSTNGVKVTWNKVSDTASYTVYRKVSGGSWAAIKKNVTGTSYTDTTAKSGTKYYYTVRAVNGSMQSNFKASNAVTYMQVVAAKAANTATGIKVTWNKITGVDSYKVYRKVSGGSWVAIKSGLTGTSYTDTKAAAGKTYDYMVRGVKGSALSNYKSSSAIKRLAQPAAKVSNVSTGVKVTWGKITGASSYTVYRKLSGGSWTAIKSGLTGTSYTDTSAPTGTLYYTVRAVSGSSASSYKGSSAVNFVKIPTAKAASVHNGIKITWGADKAADSFRVYRKVSGGSWVGLKSGLKGTSYTDTTAKSGKTYYYTVKAVKGSQLSGYKSTAALKYFAAPAISAVQSVDNGIKITWNKVSGAEKYELYQSINGGAYTKLTTTTGTSYTSKVSASPVDMIYSFKVRAVKGSSKSGYSAVKQTPYLSTPKVTCKAITGGIELDWDMGMSAEKYQVYRKTSGGSWKKIATTAVSHYTDTNAVKGTTYYYTVKSLRTLNGETLYSSFKSSSAVKLTK